MYRAILHDSLSTNHTAVLPVPPPGCSPLPDSSWLPFFHAARAALVSVGLVKDPALPASERERRGGRRGKWGGGGGGGGGLPTH